MSTQFESTDRNQRIIETDVIAFFRTLTPPVDITSGKIGFTLRINPNDFKKISYLQVNIVLDARQKSDVITQYPELEEVVDPENGR